MKRFKDIKIYIFNYGFSYRKKLKRWVSLRVVKPIKLKNLFADRSFGFDGQPVSFIKKGWGCSLGNWSY